jgi:predicted transcriptional regulator
MQSRIVRIDMHIRDERVLAWIRERAARQGGRVVLTHDEIAAAFLCHRNTARAIVLRLAWGGFVKIDDSHKRGGYTYEPLEVSA